MDKENVTENRSMYVVKSNLFVRQSRSNLTLLERKVILFAISKIKPSAMYFESITISLKGLGRILGANLDGGSGLRKIKEALMSILNKNFWLEQPDGKTVSAHWLTDVEIDTKTNIVTLKLDNKLRPYLLDLHESYTQYQLMNALALSSVYAVALYELLVSYKSVAAVKITVDELRKYLQCENKNTEFKRFHSRILKCAIDQINTLTDLVVTYEIEKENKWAKYVIFYIKEKDVADRLITAAKVEELLDG